MKVFLALFSWFLLASITFAESCPTVKDIKTHHLKNWKAYDSEDGKPISEKRFNQFSKLAEEFALAEWTRSGSIRCYYRDKNGSNPYVFLGKNHFRPNNAKNYWYEVSGLTQCAAGTERCLFNHVLAQPILAKK